MELAAYLDRIGLDTVPRADLAGLRTLHRAHLRAIPYENLDVPLGHPVTIEIPAIYDKLVTRRRGGWCYEMNGLFGWALDELGFDVTRATGAVERSVRGPASEGNHLVLKVELEEGTYLADVGFGDGPLDPFRVAARRFSINGFPFSISQIDAEWWRLHNHPAGGAPNFDFHLAPAKESAARRAMPVAADERRLTLRAECHRHAPRRGWLDCAARPRFTRHHAGQCRRDDHRRCR